MGLGRMSNDPQILRIKSSVSVCSYEGRQMLNKIHVKLHFHLFLSVSERSRYIIESVTILLFF